MTSSPKFAPAIDGRRAATPEARPQNRLALPYLAQQFGLSEAEVDLLLIALAPELEPRYETLYAYLQDDVTRKRPSVDLSLNLICRSEREKLFARRLLGPGAPLLHYQLLRLEEEPQDRPALSSRKFLKLAPTVLRFLLDEPADTAESGRLASPSPDAALADLSDHSRDMLHAAIESILRGESRQSVIAACAATIQLRSNPPRRSWLRPSIPVCSRSISRRPRPNPPACRPPFVTPRCSTRCWRSPRPSRPPVRPPSVRPARSGSSGPASHACRRRSRCSVHPRPSPASPPKAPICASGPSISPVPISRAAGTPGQRIFRPRAPLPTPLLSPIVFTSAARAIRLAVTLAFTAAALRDPSNPQPTQSDFTAAGRSLSTPNLTRFAVSIIPRYTWPDVVLPPDKMAQLHAISARVRRRRQVLDEWGFGRKLSRGKGNIALFAGPPGTGKTMVAEAMADELGLNLFQIDLSTVVSKYIGETESNLSAIFREAENTSTLLFFDEADALFTKRTEVKDALDRYANQEVNYLLQRVEQYEGLVILATNLAKNMDDAFLRRIQTVVDFPMPGESQRERIWRLQFPREAPVDSSIDFPFLAHQFKLSGGSIRNISFSAAFAAAEEGVPIGMRHLTSALRMETLKEGKLLMNSELGPYLHLLQPPAGKAPEVQS